MKHTIKNNKIEATIKQYGAELCSLKKLNSNLEYIWQAHEKYWARHSPVLFPIVGKLLENKYTYKNTTYEMGQHGFARDKEFEVVSKDENSITFKLEESKDSLKIYPFFFTLYITYTLDESSLKISYKVVNKGEDTLYFSIGAHPAFNWPLEDENKQECYLEFNKIDILQRYPLTNDGISENIEILKLNDNKLNLNEELFKDDAIVLNDKDIKEVTFKNKTNDKFIKVSFDGFDYLGIWSKPSGSDFLCIEPWCGVADFINHNQKLEEKRGIEKLEKNAVFERFFTISI